jgi:Cdc25 family phosphatase
MYGIIITVLLKRPVDNTIEQELAEIMKSDKVPGKDYLVVDVRDDDYAGGNIKNSFNQPSAEFLMNVDRLVQRTKDVPLVIFHCSLSQMR